MSKKKKKVRRDSEKTEETLGVMLSFTKEHQYLEMARKDFLQDLQRKHRFLNIKTVGLSSCCFKVHGNRETTILPFSGKDISTYPEDSKLWVAMLKPEASSPQCPGSIFWMLGVDLSLFGYIPCLKIWKTPIRRCSSHTHSSTACSLKPHLRDTL